MFKHLGLFFSNRRYIATGIVFFVNAILFAFWITRIPEVKTALSLSEGQLGLALFSMPVGAVISMFTVTLLTQRYGAGRVTIFTSIFYIGCILLPLLANNFWLLAASLFMVGLSSGAMDIAMNAVASVLEKTDKVEIMSTCHGFFSLGGMVGAGIGSFFIAIEVDSVPQMLGGMIAMLGVLLIVAKPVLFQIVEQEEVAESFFSLPGKALVGLAIVSFCSMQGEGGVADWGAVYMQQVVMSEPYMWGLAFTGFAATMTLVRFAGDTIVARFGSIRVILSASVIVALGLSLILSAMPWLSIVGFSVAGLGYALLVPVVFSEAGKQPGVSPSRGIAAVAMFGYFGFLIGPVIIGGISEWLSLQAGFAYLLIFTLIALLSFILIERGKQTA